MILLTDDVILYIEYFNQENASVAFQKERVKNTFKALALFLFVLFLTGCSSSGDSSNSENSDNADSNTISEKSVVLTIAAHPDNTLMANADIALSESASVVIDYSAADTDTYSITDQQTAMDHEMTIVGMRSETIYTITATATFEDGTVLSGDSVQFTTGELPEGAPVVTLTTSKDGSAGGVTFFGLSGQLDDGLPVYWGIDEVGEIIWYLNSDESTGVPIIRAVEPGVTLAFFQDSIQAITPAGEIVETFSLSASSSYHHDARLLENGHIVALVAESQRVDGEMLAGDKIVEFDATGNIIWEWSTFDHLDTTRFPGDLSTTETRSGALDWTHSNAICYIESEKSLLLSVRSQGWVIKIDHVTGDVIWIMGDSGGTDSSYENNDKFFTLESGEWMTGQHAAIVTSDDEILLYDNRNESNGATLMSRAVKYRLDDLTLTAEQTWEGLATNYTSSMGDVDELSNGNVLVCAAGGRASSGLNISEMASDASGEIIWSVSSDKNIYRAERVSWDSFLTIK